MSQLGRPPREFTAEEVRRYATMAALNWSRRRIAADLGLGVAIVRRLEVSSEARALVEYNRDIIAAALRGGA